MRTTRLITSLALLAVSVSATAADLYVCKQANGVKAYQDQPCAKTAKQISHDTYTPHVYAPPAPTQPVNDSVVGPGGAPPPWQATYDQPVATVPTPQVPVDTGCRGIGCTAQQRGEVHTQECVAPNGRAYYTTGACKTRVNIVGQQPRGWQTDHVEGVPGAIMTGPDTALDPYTGRVIQLEHVPDQTPVYQRARDAGASIPVADACALARQDAHAHPRDHAAARRANTVCNQGRGLWDQAPPDRDIH